MLILVAGSIVSARIERTVSEKLREAGFESKNVSVNLISRSIELDSIVYIPGQTLTNSHRGFIQKIKASNFHVIA
jgi:hypothetical protein